MFDFTVISGGTVYLVAPLTNAARTHLLEHVEQGAQWLGIALAVEHRYVADLVFALRDNGFSVEIL